VEAGAVDEDQRREVLPPEIEVVVGLAFDLDEAAHGDTHRLSIAPRGTRGDKISGARGPTGGAAATADLSS
jgi:hypothetical protein